MKRNCIIMIEQLWEKDWAPRVVEQVRMRTVNWAEAASTVRFPNQAEHLDLRR